MKLTDIMMWFENLMEPDTDSLFRGDCDGYLYREQSQGQRLQRRGHQTHVKGICVIQMFELVSRAPSYPGSGYWAGVNIQKSPFMPSKNGEPVSEYGLEFGMKLHEEIDMRQNNRGLKIPMQHWEQKKWCPGLIPSQWLSLVP